MAEYPPPQENLPIFNSQEFLIPLNATITKAEADAVYLARTGVASSNASITVFGGQVQVSPTPSNTGLNGLQVSSAIFGRNDITANSFNGVLGYTRHPIGWTIVMNKVIANLPSNLTTNVITFGTINTEFTTLSNGIWMLGANISNASSAGVCTTLSTRFAISAGGTLLNTAQCSQPVSGTFELDMNNTIIRVTGNGSTAIDYFIYTLWSVQPTFTFNLYAIKLG